MFCEVKVGTCGQSFRDVDLVPGNYVSSSEKVMVRSGLDLV